jgi:hypothetical protein
MASVCVCVCGYICACVVGGVFVSVVEFWNSTIGEIKEMCKKNISLFNTTYRSIRQQRGIFMSWRFIPWYIQNSPRWLLWDNGIMRWQTYKMSMLCSLKYAYRIVIFYHLEMRLFALTIWNSWTEWHNLCFTTVTVPPFQHNVTFCASQLLLPLLVLQNSYCSSLPTKCHILCFTKVTVPLSVVSILATGNRVRGLKTGWSRWIFSGIEKYPQNAFLRKGSKICPMLQLCGMWKNPSVFRELWLWWQNWENGIVPAFAGKGLALLHDVWRLWKWLRALIVRGKNKKVTEVVEPGGRSFEISPVKSDFTFTFKQQNYH